MTVLTGRGSIERPAVCKLGSGDRLRVPGADGCMPYRVVDRTCSRTCSFVVPFSVSAGRRGSPSECDSSDVRKFVRIDDPAVRADQTACDLHRVDAVDAALPEEHEGELPADLDEIDVVRTPLATHPHHHLGNALTTMDELACRRHLATTIGDVDGVRVQKPDQAGQVTRFV